MKVNVHYRDGTVLEYKNIFSIKSDIHQVCLSTKNECVEYISKFKIKSIKIKEVNDDE